MSSYSSSMPRIRCAPSSMPRIRCDPRKFRTRGITHYAQAMNVFGHHVSGHPIKTFKMLMFKFIEYDKEAAHGAHDR